MKGIVGSVTRHPPADWNDLCEFTPPDLMTDSGKDPIDWRSVARDIGKAKDIGQLTIGGLRHGHVFQTLADIRSYENLLFDMVEHFNLAIVQTYVDLGVEWMCYPEDLGMQTGPMISPEMFRRCIKPSYERLMKPARDAGCVIHVHSDGCIHGLVDDLTDGVHAINLQDLVNGIDWIKDTLAGRIGIDLDIDRQRITPSGTPQQIDTLIWEEVTTLGSRKGGLMMIYGLYPGVPLENVKALMDVMERYAGLFS